jgi:hypothetical protein
MDQENAMKGKSAYQPPPEHLRQMAAHRQQMRAEERAIVWEAAAALLAGVACVGLLLAWLFWVVHP